MVNKCSVVGCKTVEKSAVFQIPNKNLDLKERWINFLNRQDLLQKDTFLFVCVCHFQDKYLNRENGQRTRLKSHLNAVPTIHPESIIKSTPSLLPNLSS